MNMKEILKLMGVLAIATGTTISTTACVWGGASSNKVVITDLNTIIKIKDLGNVYVGQNDKPNKQEVLDAIKIKNPQVKLLTVDNFNFDHGSPSATISGIGNYKGKIFLNFKIISIKSR